MSERIHALAQLLLGKSSIEDCSLEEVRQLVKNYPYFSPAQFLWLQKLKEHDPSQYEAAFQKAILYYHNPLEFPYFLNPEKFYLDLSTVKSLNHITTGLEETAEVKTQLAETAAPVEEMQSTTEIFNETPAVETAEVEEEEIKTEAEEITAQPTLTETEGKPIEKNLEATPAAIAPAAEEEVETALLRAEEMATQNDNKPAEAVTPLPAEVLPETEAGPAEEKPAEKTPASELVFEPYHTVDYFASQGIKPVVDEKPKNKFDQQLRSFTGWLKEFKKMPIADLTKKIDQQAEKNVENLAAHSVDQSEVVTEAMAEVWLKQGNIEKAIETYNKLSLLNPSKKAFFAAKIESLKSS